MMNKIRDWSFPVGVLLAWLAVSAFIVRNLSEMSHDWDARRNAAPLSQPAKTDDATLAFGNHRTKLESIDADCFQGNA